MPHWEQAGVMIRWYNCLLRVRTCWLRCCDQLVRFEPGVLLAPRIVLDAVFIQQVQAGNHPILNLKCLDPGRGQKIPAILHGAGAYHGVFIPET